MEEPEPEKSTPSAEHPVEPPKRPEAEPSETEYKKKLDVLFWLRVGLAVAGGVAATFVFDSVEGEERRWASIGLMIIIFSVTIVIAKGMKMQLPSSDRKKLVTQGIGSYIFLYLFMWIVSYTLVNISSLEEIPSILG